MNKDKLASRFAEFPGLEKALTFAAPGIRISREFQRRIIRFQVLYLEGHILNMTFEDETTIERAIGTFQYPTVQALAMTHKIIAVHKSGATKPLHIVGSMTRNPLAPYEDEGVPHYDGDPLCPELFHVEDLSFVVDVKAVDQRLTESVTGDFSDPDGCHLLRRRHWFEVTLYRPTPSFESARTEHIASIKREDELNNRYGSWRSGSDGIWRDSNSDSGKLFGRPRIVRVP